MKFSSVQILLILGVAVSTTSAECWWTKCQPKDWGVRGCGQQNVEERGNRVCRDNRGVEGNEYYCCSRGNGNDGSQRDGLVSFSEFRDAVTRSGQGTRVPTQEQFNFFTTNSRNWGQISDKQELAMALAHMILESKGLSELREVRCVPSQCPKDYRHDCDRDGQYYYGRGYIQLTWCYNYEPASHAIFNDDRLLNNPDQVASNDETAWKTSFWFWGNKVHGKPGVAEGRFGVTTRFVNGNECNEPNNEVARRRFEIYGVVRQAFGLPGNGDPSGCY